MPAPTAAVKAVQALRTAEQGALTGQRSYYTGSGRDADDGTERVKVKGKLKSKIVTIILIAVFGGGAAFLGTSHSLLAPAIESLFTSATDTQYTSSNLRTARLTKFILNPNQYVKTNWLGAKKYKNFNSSFQKRLAKHNITVETDPNTHTKFLQFTQTNSDGLVTTKNISAAEFVDTINTDVDFREQFQGATRGRIATFFDNIADKIYKKLGISRNLFSNFQQSIDNSVNLENFNNTMSEKFNGNSSTLGVTNTEEKFKEVETTDKNGNTTTTLEPDGEGPVTAASSSASSDSADSASGFAKASSMLSSVASSVAKVGSYACTIMRVGSMISITVAANEIYQSINYYMGLSENISKTKAGYGNEAALSETLNLLTTSTTSKINNLSGVVSYGGEDDLSFAISGDDGEYTTLTGAPVESTGMQAILTGTTSSSSTSQTNQLFSLERVGNSILNAARMSVAKAATCIGVDVAQATISSIISIGTALATGGASYIVSNIVNMAIGTALGVAVSVALGFLIPTIAQAFFTNIFEDASGIVAGELFAKGASAANTRVGRNGSGQSLSTAEVAVAYNHATNTVLALDAEIDRNTLSPFDITNKNTFLGSIAYSLLPLSTSSTITSLGSLLRTTATSLSSLMGGAYAEGEDSSYMTTFGSCPMLEGIGAVGDMYCNPVTSTDLSTIDLEPDDPTYQQALENNGLDCSGDECEVQSDSDLAKYITYCDGRDSPFGVVDQNILNASNLTTSNTVLDSFISSIPVIGDAIDIWNAHKSSENLDWSNGQKCVATNTPGDSNYDFWQTEGKYFQRYVEDMRLLDQIGDESTNPVTAYEDAYEAAHPLDNSYTGYLSRISGLTPENIEIVLAFVDYYQYLDDYNPTTRIALQDYNNSLKSGPEIIADISRDHLYFKDNSLIKETTPSGVIARKHLLYENLRDRNFVV